MAFRDHPIQQQALCVSADDLRRRALSRTSLGLSTPTSAVHPALDVFLEERDHFTEDEVQALLNLPKLSIRDRLVLHAYLFFSKI